MQLIDSIDSEYSHITMKFYMELKKFMQMPQAWKENLGNIAMKKDSRGYVFKVNLLGQE